MNNARTVIANKKFDNMKPHHLNLNVEFIVSQYGNNECKLIKTPVKLRNYE
jgi:hypothetical protein